MGCFGSWFSAVAFLVVAVSSCTARSDKAGQKSPKNGGESGVAGASGQAGREEAAVGGASSGDTSQLGGNGEGGGDVGEGGIPVGEGGQATGEGGQVTGEGGRVTGEGGQVTGEGGQVTGEGGQGALQGGSSGDDGLYGDVHEGQYHLGPVDFAETEWHNACAPGDGYREELTEATGLGQEYLAGVSSELMDGGNICDACLQVTTGTGRSLVVRIVTYGVSNTPGDIDVSPSVYEALNTEEYPRSMSWQLANCPDTGPIYFEFQTEANPWWTSLWVRNPRVPIERVEVQSTNHAEFFELRREVDGTLNDDSGFGEGAFTLRLTGVNGVVLEETLGGFEAGELVTASIQFE